MAQLSAEERKAKQKILDEENAKKDEELSKKTYWESLKAVKEILLSDKKKIKDGKLLDEAKQDAILIIDMLANVIESSDRDAIDYAFTAYKFLAKTYKLTFFGRIKKLEAASLAMRRR